MVPFQSVGAVSYSHFVATMAVSLAVCEIVRVKKRRNGDILKKKQVAMLS